MTARSLAFLAALPLAFSLLPVRPALAQGPAPFPDRPGIEITGRLEVMYSTSADESVPDGAWTLRRSRIGSRFRLNRVVSGRLQPDYSAGELTLKDVFLQFEAGPGFRLLAGQSHRPFSPLARASELRIPVIEKTAKMRGLTALDAQELVQSLGYTGRDIGVQLLGAVPLHDLPLQYELALVRGPLDTGEPGLDPYQLGARLSAQVAPGVRVGAAWSRREFAPGDAEAVAGTRHGSAYVTDAELGSYDRGPHVIGELMTGAVDPFQGSRFRAVQAVGSYRFNPRTRLLTGVEPGLRASLSRLHGGDGEGGALLTPGLSAYLRGQNRLALNYDRWRPASGGSARHDWKVLFQLAF